MKTTSKEQDSVAITTSNLGDYCDKVITGRIWQGNGVLASVTGILSGPYNGTYVITGEHAVMYMPENPKCMRVGEYALFDRWV